MPDPVSILWLRQDLRLADQPALVAAAGEGRVVPVYVLDDATPGAWAIGGAQRWWLHHSLASLNTALRKHGSRLILRRGKAAEIIAQVAKECGAERIHAIRHYEPWWCAAEAELAQRLDLVLHDGNQLAPPRSVREGGGYRVYGAFWRALERIMPPEKPVAPPDDIAGPAKWPTSEKLADWGLPPDRPDWAAAFGDDWHPGEEGAQVHLDTFAEVVGAYATARDMPGEEGTSRLSPHLHHGEISPRQVWHALRGADAAKFRRELAWRDFTQGIIRQLPDYGDANGRAAFDALPWRPLTDAAAKSDFTAWTKGQTGYPIVDAGMRQLWTSGWMHNRVRMITASFLVKHLLIDWREGERWFWDTLVDADYGNNSVNWQWIAGSGVDSNPFGRIMAPLSQSAKFDAADYIRRWVPELAGLADDVIHDPEEAGARVKGYPAKLIGHREARERALSAGRTLRG